MKQVIHYLLILIFLMIPVDAHYDLSTDESIMYLYDTNDISIGFTASTDGRGYAINPNKTICVNNTCISGWCDNYCRGAYDLEYDFTYRLSETEYQTVVVRIKQTIVSSTWFTNTVNRKIYIDGQEVLHKNDVDISKYIYPKAFHFAFIFEDTTVELDDKTDTNQTLLFTELDLSDQYDLLRENNDNHITWHFNTLSDDTSSITKFGGLIGVLYNVMGKIPGVGESIQNVIFLPLFLIQSIIDISATFIMIIISDWYYLIMLVQIICMAKALRSKNDVYHIAQDYLLTNVLIIMYVKDHLVMPFITLVLKIIVIIRNMFRI